MKSNKLKFNAMWFKAGRSCQVRTIEHDSESQIRAAQFILTPEQYEPMKTRLALCTYDEALEHLTKYAKPLVSEFDTQRRLESRNKTKAKIAKFGGLDVPESTIGM